MSPVYLRDLGFQRNQPEDREGLSRTRRPGGIQLGHSGGWQNNELHQLLKDLFQWSIDNKRFNLATHWEELRASWQRIGLKEIDFKDLMVITKGSFQEKTRKQGKKQDLLQPEEERVRPHDPEALAFGERSAQEPEVVVNNFRISSPINTTITPTQIEHNVVTPERNLKSDALWLQMSQYAEKTQKQFTELEESHERMKEFTASMDKIVKALQQGHAQLRKASEENNKRLNLVFEEQHHSKRDRDCRDQDINKLFNVYHSMKPQPQVHVMDNPYHQDDIKPDPMLMKKGKISITIPGWGEYVLFWEGSLETAS
ncbi:hypothetical protein O181_069031 [Austropuccinia psidii MF-1]|uniref:Uncharacterized protein n=1 Tax=Austropuccinia psidii MF-1 TaxID=1389203 RepID=A0A9Q3I4F8_9BASI|nr:hypothetical protein [Austropuccinia psidii MF-1]